MEWKFAEAKNKISELINKALSEGPQRVSCREDVVIVIAERDYENLTVKRPSFKEFLLKDEPSLEGLDLSRDHSSVRDVKL